MFLRKNNQNVFVKNKKIKSLSLPTHIRRAVLHVTKTILSNASKRMHGETSLSISGSVTVEASFVLSFFILLSATLFSLFFVLQKDVNLVCDLNDSAQKIAAYANPAEDYDGDVFLANGFSEHISYLPEWTGNFYICEEAYRRPWTGRIIENKKDNEGEETYVFVAENGTVYHTTESCTHLSLTINMTSLDVVGTCRNANGGRYRACEKCGAKAKDIVFVAREGDCYHSDRNCSGLKRSYRKVKLTEVNLPACSRCGE